MSKKKRKNEFFSTKQITAIAKCAKKLQKEDGVTEVVVYHPSGRGLSINSHGGINTFENATGYDPFDSCDDDYEVITDENRFRDVIGFLIKPEEVKAYLESGFFNHHPKDTLEAHVLLSEPLKVYRCALFNTYKVDATAENPGWGLREAFAKAFSESSRFDMTLTFRHPRGAVTLAKVGIGDIYSDYLKEFKNNTIPDITELGRCITPIELVAEDTREAELADREEFICDFIQIITDSISTYLEREIPEKLAELNLGWYSEDDYFRFVHYLSEFIMGAVLKIVMVPETPGYAVGPMRFTFAKALRPHSLRETNLVSPHPLNVEIKIDYSVGEHSGRYTITNTHECFENLKEE